MYATKHKLLIFKIESSGTSNFVFLFTFMFLDVKSGRNLNGGPDFCKTVDIFITLNTVGKVGAFSLTTHFAKCKLITSTNQLRCTHLMQSTAKQWYGEIGIELK